MSNEIGLQELKNILLGAVDAIDRNHERLSQMDTLIGDGDHGVTMLRAMKNVRTAVENYKGESLKGLLNDAGWGLLSVDGGATGPLFGSLFLGMSEALSDQLTMDGPTLARMFEAGLAELSKQTMAKPGDKTMVDAVVPGVAALRQAADEGKSPLEMLDVAARAAMNGAVSTKEFRARFGRAKNQGDRTIGVQDPGATSTALIFQGMHDGLAGSK
jgi:phosphoenolpyruvate---glycerone phosphotransferase subunit DhaL